MDRLETGTLSSTMGSQSVNVAAMGPKAEREREERRSADVASAHADVASAHAVIPKKAEY